MRSALTFAVLSLGLVGAGHAAPSYTGKAPSFMPMGQVFTTIYADAPVLDSRTWNPAPNGSVAVVDRAPLTTRGATATVTATRTVSNAAIKTGLKTVARNFIPGVNIAMTIWDLLDDKGIEPTGDTITIDVGQPDILIGGWMADFRSGQLMRPSQIVAREAGNACTGQGGGEAQLTCGVDIQTSSCANGWCTWSFRARVRYPNGTIAWDIAGSDTAPDVTSLGCPENVTRLPLAGPSGPCKMGQRVPVPDNILDGLVTEIPDTELPNWARDISKALPGGLPTSSEHPELSGPPHVDAPPKVTTKPDGTVETETVRRTLDYPPNTGTVVIGGDTTVISNAEGDTTITNSGGGSGETDCDKYPAIIGCSLYGTPEGDGKAPRTVNIDLDTDSYGDGSCPPDRTFAAFGHDYVISWQPICDATVTYVKPVVLLMAGAFAAFLFIGGLKA